MYQIKSPQKGLFLYAVTVSDYPYLKSNHFLGKPSIIAEIYDCMA
ncbi:hypothetical protein NIES37_32600 [Tolypothrix tenuis PCC 7101]|uniref:Uncharacterized protein n=1 Tax=Tolypothrix tenuis PCC 7101 TaxID=231146 RepID=A0A1Z4N0X9_9CYAN|nr:hypothetical protein NIES37_32600 [Tolypothrix tenuis PCC 7101]BAZ76796.1 hypothetical protein NIES50_53980 [Aulosira laxa NIES-50]